jgi:drug/metabolite transporter (DMT)-like permease
LQVILIGILASLFFASTFVINRAMDLSGGSWIWSASLRYLFTVPLLLLIVMTRRNMKALIDEMKMQPLSWIVWSTVGFGLFYAPLCFAAAYGPAWLVAGTWQITIVAGSLLVPLFYEEKRTANGVRKIRHRIPLQEMVTSIFILMGVVLLHNKASSSIEMTQLALGFLPVLVAAFAYPLGNRKMMAICKDKLDVYQRVLGMTMASIPFWLVLSLYGIKTVGLPSSEQIVQSFIVAICSGIIATVLFFYATDKAEGNPKKLAAVEATQSGEVVFTVFGEVIFLKGEIPAGGSLIGIIIIIMGMVLHSMKLAQK